MSMKMSESLYRIRHEWHAVGEPNEIQEEKSMADRKPSRDDPRSGREDKPSRLRHDDIDEMGSSRRGDSRM
jgi:hypothetical protein